MAGPFGVWGGGIAGEHQRSHSKYFPHSFPVGVTPEPLPGFVHPLLRGGAMVHTETLDICFLRQYVSGGISISFWEVEVKH